MFAERFYYLSAAFAVFLLCSGAAWGAGNFDNNPTIMVTYQQKLDEESVESHKQSISGLSQTEEADVRAVCARVQDYYISKEFDKKPAVDCEGESIGSLSDKIPTLIDVMTRWTGYRQSTKYCTHFYPIPCSDISGAKYFKSFQSSFYDLTKKNMPRPELYISGIAGRCMKSSETGLGYSFGSDAYLTVYGDSDIPNFDSADVDIVSFCFYPVYEKQISAMGFKSYKNSGISGDDMKDDVGFAVGQELPGTKSGFIGSVGEGGGEIPIGAEPEKNQVRACCGVADSGTACSKEGIWPNIRARYKQMIQDSGGADCNSDPKSRRLADLCVKSGEVCNKYDSKDDWKNGWHSKFTKIESEFQLIFRNSNIRNVNDKQWDDYIKAMRI